MSIIEPLTADRWEDFEHLFGLNGACGGCWCMWWRVSVKEFEAGTDVNRERMRALVEQRPTKLLAYDAELYTGTVTMFEAAGFRPVHQAKPTSRIVMRRPVAGPG